MNHHDELKNNLLTKRIVEEARSWIGTAFHQLGRVKKTGTQQGGCDCLGLIIGTLDNLGILSKDKLSFKEYDPIHYSAVSDGHLLTKNLANHFLPISKKDLKEGDIVLFEFNNNPQHLAFIASSNNNLTIIHSFIQAKKVVEHYFSKWWLDKVIASYRIINFY